MEFKILKLGIKGTFAGQGSAADSVAISMSRSFLAWHSGIPAIANPRWVLAVGLILVALLGAGILRQFWVAHADTGALMGSKCALRGDLQPGQRLTAHIDETDLQKCLLVYMDLTGRGLWPDTNGLAAKLDGIAGGRFRRWNWINRAPQPDSGIIYHADGALRADDTKARIEAVFAQANLRCIPVGERYLQIRAAAPAGSVNP
jgi:hypothetical protein